MPFVAGIRVENSQPIEIVDLLVTQQATVYQVPADFVENAQSTGSLVLKKVPDIHHDLIFGKLQFLIDTVRSPKNENI